MSTSILPGERPDRLEEECAVFGVFVDDDAADRCAAALSAQWDTVFVCRPCSGIDLSEQIV